MTPYLVAVLAALACVSEARAQVLHRTVDVDGVSRDYIAYLPSSYDGSPTPILFALHGWGGTAQSFMHYADFRPLADAHSFIAVYPQALVGDEGEPSWDSEGPFSTGVDEMGFVEAMIDALAADFSIDETRVYLTGYSSASSVIWDAACRLSDRIAAVGTVAGVMWNWTHQACAPSHPTAVITVHGTNDFILPYNGTPYSLSLPATSDYWSSYNNTDATADVEQLPDIDPTDGSTVERQIWDNGDGCVSVVHYRVISGGHDWPGVDGNMDMDANLVLWDFLSQYDTSGLIGCGDRTPRVADGLNEKSGEVLQRR